LLQRHVRVVFTKYIAITENRQDFAEELDGTMDFSELPKEGGKLMTLSTSQDLGNGKFPQEKGY
jgi:hypothetical protein